MPSGTDKLALFGVIRDELIAAGYRAIGMDHFALPSDELAAAAAKQTLGRDFQGYTVQRAPHTVALGVSGIGDLGDAYAQNVKSLTHYQRAIADGRLATERGIALDEDDRLRREVIQELMCNFAVEVDEGRLGPSSRGSASMPATGWSSSTAGGSPVTPLGRLFVRNLAMVFDAYLDGGEARFSRRCERADHSMSIRSKRRIAAHSGAAIQNSAAAPRVKPLASQPGSERVSAITWRTAGTRSTLASRNTSVGLRRSSPEIQGKRTWLPLCPAASSRCNSSTLGA